MVEAHVGSPADTSKLRGGYYTPDALARVLTGLAVRRGDRVLEPSAGDGAFITHAARRSGLDGRVVAVELDPGEARKIDRTSPASVEVVTGDVFAWYLKSEQPTFDAVVGNPPFIRYQTFPEEHRQAGFELMRREGLRPNRLTNAWVPFVVLSVRALRDGGRLGMVLPGELLQVTYAAELREYLARNFSHITVATFRRLVFEGIQQETVLLHGTRKREAQARMRFVELGDASDLTQKALTTGPGVPADLDHGREKWTQYYLSEHELGLIREIEASDTITNLGSLAEVDVGIVTGRNEFFVLTPSEARQLRLTRSCLPLVGRSAQIPGLVLRPDEFASLKTSDTKCLLLSLGDVDRDRLSEAARRYVSSAEAAGMHTGYKTSLRLPNWWQVPSAWAPDAFLLRQIHDGPRIVANEAGAYCTDTIHRVRTIDGVSAAWLAATSMNSLTWAFSEIRGRSYGGGVLELEPTEAEGLPYPRPCGDLPLDDLDLWSRRKEPEQVLDEVDRLVLLPAGLTQAETTTLREIWRKMSSRRRDRKRA